MAWDISIENIAGIRHGEAHLEPGSTAVRASNWQGKSSFLSAIKTAFGTVAPLTEGQQHGAVTLETESKTVTVTLERTADGVTKTGTPYLTDEYDRVCAALFAFLDEENDIRRAVRDGNSLEALLTRPLDFENLDHRIASLRAEREQVEAELERATAATNRLAAHHQRVEQLEAELDGLREKRDELAPATEENAASETLRDDKAALAAVEDRISRLDGTTARARERLGDQQAELDALDIPATGALEDELANVHAALRDKERDTELLQSVFEANKRVVDEGRAELLTDVSHDLLADSMVCWVCGHDTTSGDVDTHLAALNQRITSLREGASANRTRVDELEAKRDEARQAKRRAADVKDSIAELKAQLAEAAEALNDARDRREALAQTVEKRERTVVSEAKQVTEVEAQRKYTEAALEDARDELEATNAAANQREGLLDAQATVTEEITTLRNRKETITDRMRAAFSAAFTDIVARFDLGFETARLTSTFDLVVAREGREAHLDALSEGERDLLGFIIALAGHEAFGVGERVPIILLDGLGGLASENLGTLVEYLTDRTDYLVFTSYPEHEHRGGAELSPAAWDVVSNPPDGEPVS